MMYRMGNQGMGVNSSSSCASLLSFEEERKLPVKKIVRSRYQRLSGSAGVYGLTRQTLDQQRKSKSCILTECIQCRKCSTFFRLQFKT